jgi:site-specific recombinase XerD
MRAGKTAPKSLTAQEVRQLLQVTGRSERDIRDHVLLLLALSTGLRVSELVGLNVGDVRGGKGVKSVVTLRPETTKGHREGEVVLAEKVRRKVANYLGWKKTMGEGLNDDAPMFLSRGGGRAGATRGSRLSIRTAEHLFGTWQARAGFERRANFHILRHTFATALLRKTKNVRLVQVACRHVSLSTTAIYTHPSMQERVDAADCLTW